MNDTRTLISWEEFKKKEFEKPAWLVNPYIPASGAIVFFWGETSTGKSPLGWNLAAAVGRGDNFFGLPANQGRVLYIDVDTPQRLVHQRLSGVEPAPNVDFLFLPPLSVPAPAAPDQALLDRAAAREYDLVVINTLRKVHNLDDKDSATPQLVYSYFQHQFPGSTLVFVHHTKKPQADAQMRLKDNFSGAMNWLNDAQVGLALTSYESEREGINIRLNHEKSQVSDLYKPLGLRLESDGVTIRCPKFEQLLRTYEFLNSDEGAELGGLGLIKRLEQVVGCSQDHAYKLKSIVVGGFFPGVEWLGRKKGGEE